MFDAFTQQAVEVLWVIADRDQQLLADQGLRAPPHVHATSFAPQNSVLGHPNTIAFITQGGTNSVQEVCQQALAMRLASQSFPTLMPCEGCRSGALKQCDQHCTCVLCD